MEFWNETRPIARSEHRCEACYQAIEPGVQYAKMAGKSDGDFFAVKQHIECRAAECALAVLKDLHGGEDWCHLNDLDEPDDLPWLQAEHPIVFGRIKERYSDWLSASDA